MSRNQRRRQTHSKRKKIVNKSKYKKQNSLDLKKRLSAITFSSIQNNISSKLSNIKNSIFKTRDYKKIFGEFIGDIKSYTKKNKKSVIFSVSIYLDTSILDASNPPSYHFCILRISLQQDDAWKAVTIYLGGSIITSRES